MKFLKHENFFDAYANIVRHFEFQWHGEASLQFPQEIWPDISEPGEWVQYVSNRRWEHRPTILTIDDGIRENAVGKAIIQQSGCNFLVLERQWANLRFEDFCWKIIRYWPDICKVAKSAHDGGHHCRISFSTSGKDRHVNY